MDHETNSCDTISTKVADVYKIKPEDKDIAQKFMKTLAALQDVKKQLKEQDPTKYPFDTAISKRAARNLCLSNIQSEIATLELFISVIHCKGIEREHDFTETMFLDFHAITPWLQHVSKLHAEHMEGIHSMFVALIANHPDRETFIDKLFQSQLKCTKHTTQPAVARSLDGKGFICAECLLLAEGKEVICAESLLLAEGKEEVVVE